MEMLKESNFQQSIEKEKISWIKKIFASGHDEEKNKFNSVSKPTNVILNILFVPFSLSYPSSTINICTNVPVEIVS